MVSALDPKRIRLAIQGQEVAWLEISMAFGWDRERLYLAVEQSKFAVGAAGLGEPFIRVEYVRARDYAPAHINFHAESGAIGYIFGLAGKTHIPKIQSLHLPVGSKRFRPCVEDIIEFLAHDLGMDMLDGWEEAVAQGRQKWAERQLGAAVRDDFETAIRTLQEAGYTVAPADP